MASVLTGLTEGRGASEGLRGGSVFQRPVDSDKRSSGQFKIFAFIRCFAVCSFHSQEFLVAASCGVIFHTDT